MKATVAWVALAAPGAAALGGLLLLAPASPRGRVPVPLAAALGVAAGALLFAAVARRRPHPLRGRALSQVALLGAWAASEELFWRRFALAALLPHGAVPALAASTVAFATLHGRRPFAHLGTGGVFGAIYLATGALAAPIGAHWVYNVLVGGDVRRRGS